MDWKQARARAKEANQAAERCAAAWRVGRPRTIARALTDARIAEDAAQEARDRAASAEPEDPGWAVHWMAEAARRAALAALPQEAADAAEAARQAADATDVPLGKRGFLRTALRAAERNARAAAVEADRRALSAPWTPPPPDDGDELRAAAERAVTAAEAALRAARAVLELTVPPREDDV